MNNYEEYEYSIILREHPKLKMGGWKNTRETIFDLKENRRLFEAIKELLYSTV